MQQTLLAPRALNLIRDPLYTYTRKLEFYDFDFDGG